MPPLDDTTTNETAETETPDTATKDRAKVTIDHATESVSVEKADGTSVSGSLAGIPDNVRQHLALVALGRILVTAKSPSDTLTRMQNGELPGRAAAAKPRERNHWRTAYAKAKVDQAKKAGAPISLDDALVRADELTREELIRAKQHPDVVKHYAKLTGAPAELI